MVYRQEGAALTLESAAFRGGRLIASSGGCSPNYFVADHLGSTRVILDAAGNIAGQSDYYPFGKKHDNAALMTAVNRYGYNGKEEQGFTNVPYSDYGARMYDVNIIRWTTQDPLLEKYIRMSPYLFCAGNSIRFIDMDGRKIYGYTKNDINLFVQDMKKILSAEKFNNYTTLLRVSGKGLSKISSEAFATAFKNITLSKDESTFVNLLTNQINSKESHTVEYLKDENSRSSIEAGSSVAKTAPGLVMPSGEINGATVKDVFGGAANIKSDSGTHTLIMENTENREIKSSHEVLGHGTAVSAGLSREANNDNAVRTENLTRRLMEMPQWDGTGHVPNYSTNNPFDLPITGSK